ncbi:MAG: response regulator [Candidatus Sericytochromatia bacterium]
MKDRDSYCLLVIEDNDGDFFLIEDYLSEYMATPQLMRAGTFAQAQRLLINPDFQPDLVLLDLTLPDMRGQQLIAEVLRLSTSPVVVLTGYGDIAFGLRSLELGAADHLNKDDLSALVLYKSIIYSIERLKYIQALESQNAQLREIAWIQSHAVRAPVARLLGLMQIYETDPNPGACAPQLFPLLKQSAEELDQIIRDVIQRSETALSQLAGANTDSGSNKGA